MYPRTEAPGRRRSCVSSRASTARAAICVGGTMASLAALRDALPRRLPAEFGYLASAARPFPAAPNGSAVRRAPNLLITGCGRSGTHALASLLRRHGVQAKHEGRGSEATLGWPYAGRALDWRPLWPMSAQPRATDAHEPIFKVHRHPISAVASIANGFTTSGACRNPSERRWDARAWHCASTFVPLPLGGARLGEAPRHAAATTCTLGRRERPARAALLGEVEPARRPLGGARLRCRGRQLRRPCGALVRPLRRAAQLRVPAARPQRPRRQRGGGRPAAAAVAAAATSAPRPRPPEGHAHVGGAARGRRRDGRRRVGAREEYGYGAEPGNRTARS